MHHSIDYLGATHATKKNTRACGIYDEQQDFRTSLACYLQYTVCVTTWACLPRRIWMG